MKELAAQEAKRKEEAARMTEIKRQVFRMQEAEVKAVKDKEAAAKEKVVDDQETAYAQDLKRQLEERRKKHPEMKREDATSLFLHLAGLAANLYEQGPNKDRLASLNAYMTPLEVYDMGMTEFDEKTAHATLPSDLGEIKWKCSGFERVRLPQVMAPFFRVLVKEGIQTPAALKIQLARMYTHGFAFIPELLLVAARYDTAEARICEMLLKLTAAPLSVDHIHTLVAHLDEGGPGWWRNTPKEVTRLKSRLSLFIRSATPNEMENLGYESWKSGPTTRAYECFVENIPHGLDMSPAMSHNDNAFRLYEETDLREYGFRQWNFTRDDAYPDTGFKYEDTPLGIQVQACIRGLTDILTSIKLESKETKTWSLGVVVPIIMSYTIWRHDLYQTTPLESRLYRCQREDILHGDEIVSRAEAHRLIAKAKETAKKQMDEALRARHERIMAWTEAEEQEDDFEED